MKSIACVRHPALVCVLLALTSGTNLVASEPAAEIRYTLREPCRVSLAIYDRDDIQIRTLRNSEPQPAGDHSIAWDGLDRDGNPASLGTYSWKLLQGQGLKAEYLFSFGISTRELPWVGNHDGPTALSVQGDEVMVSAGAAEGGAQLVKMSQAGNIGMAAPSPGWSTEDIARADKLVYIVSTELGRLTLVNAETGDKAWWARTNGPLTIGTVKDVTNPIPVTITGRQHLFRYDVPNPATSGWNWYLGRVTLSNTLDQPIQLKLSKNFIRGATLPFREITIAPKDTVTVELGQVIVNWDSARQFVISVEGEPGWEIQRLEILSSADRVAAARREQVPEGQAPAPVDADQYASPPWAVSDDQVWVGNRCAELIQQIQPKRDGKILRVVRVPGFQDLAFTRDGQLLVISGDAVCVLRGEKLEPIIRDLEDPRRLAVDATTGDLFVAEWGTNHQVRRFDSTYRLLRVYGREGGRQYGLYKGEDFYRIADVACDGQGGFYLVENWGARRTARFDAQGTLIREWYGGQGYQQFVTQDPRHADRFWMTGTFNTDVVECEVDWIKRDWRVRAVYNIQDELARALDGLLYITSGYVGARIHAVDRDLDGNGKAERLLWVEDSGYLLRIDEAAGRLVPLAATGFLQDNERAMLQSGQATESEKQRYAALLSAFQSYPKEVPPPRYWTWADADGDGLMQSAELRLFTGDYHGGTYVGGYFAAMQFGDDLAVWQRSGWNMPAGGPSWYVMKPEGYTKCGAPIWRLDARERSQASGEMLHALITTDGSSYEVRNMPGEGYYVPGVSRVGGHGFGWPSTMVDAIEVLCRRPDGRVLWRAGQHAPVLPNDPAQLHAPLRVAGIVKDCVGIADRSYNPLAVWTTDGLFVGDLFDRRADDGLPPTAYTCGEYRGPLPSGKERGHLLDRWGVNSGDDLFGSGLLSLASNGDVFFKSNGSNGAPMYRVTGWDELQRQQGTLVIRQAVVKPPEAGTGLAATYYAEPDFKGEATRRVDPQIWFGGKASATFKPWPNPAITSNACSAVWEGFVQPRFTEPGRLLVYVDLGLQDEKSPPPQRVRLWVNGKLELDYWEKRAWDEPHLRTRFLDLKAGERVPVKLEYSCSKDADELSLCWESPSVGVQHIPSGCLFPKP